MTRKDTILVAVVVNAGLLAILFATAIIYDTDKELVQPEMNPILAEAKDSILPQEIPNNLIAKATTGDEVDNVLSYYQTPTSTPMVIEVATENDYENLNNPVEEPLQLESKTSNSNNFVEVTVKKGDVLEKIARANGTTISAIKKANNLKSEKLQIGQVLKIPLQKSSTTQNVSVNTNTPVKKQETKETEDAVYYVIKSGDSPWKVARQFNVKFEDILRLNGLDEEKARNLKVGDRIRIK